MRFSETFANFKIKLINVRWMYLRETSKLTYVIVRSKGLNLITAHYTTKKKFFSSCR